MDRTIVGRDGVLETAWRALGDGRPVLLEGPAGIGKTAVWRALLDRARSAGWLVLSCAPAESETGLPLAALADVLEALAGDVEDLPAPQRSAAEVALLSSPGEVDERALGAAVRTLLDGREGRVLVAVDDAPWLDPPSERALRFALRRTTNVASLVSRRTTSDDAEVPLGLGRVAELVRVELGPLGVGALHHLLTDRLGTTLSRPLLARIARDSGGNPLLAIELARAVLRLPKLPRPGDDLPVAASLQDLLADRLAALQDHGREAVRLAALLSVPTTADLAAADTEAESLDPAEEAGLLAVTDGVVEFAHPMYAAAVRAGIPPGVRSRLHERLAKAVRDPDERARHLARCTTEPDEAVARELTAAAERQRARGAPELAADLHDRAAELTPAGSAQDRDRRRVAAVHCRFDSGEYAAAGEAAATVASELTGDLRAESLLVGAMVAWSIDDTDAAQAAAEQALTSAREGSPLAGRIHAHLSLFVDDVDRARDHADTAQALMSAEDDRDRALLSGAMLLLFIREVQAGARPRTDLLGQALVVEGNEPSWLAGTVPAVWWEGVDDHDRARGRLEWLLDRAVARGDEPTQHEALTHLGQVELLAGRYEQAERRITAALTLGEQIGTDLAGETWLAAMLAAYKGELDEAARVASDGLRTADEVGGPWRIRMYQRLAGFTALSAGRMADAAQAYGVLADSIGRAGKVEPIATRLEPDWIEACVGSGDLDTARDVLRRLEDRHERLPRPWTTLGLARSRVLIAAASGTAPDLDALAAAREAVPADVVPLDRARCLLVAGVAHRRARRKRQARETLTAAAAEFDALGAKAWAERAREELARIGGRPPAPLALTATEDRVATLAAKGLTNKVIADQLFISPKTVEANLARVYRKLGIGTRAELGALIGRETPDSSEGARP